MRYLTCYYTGMDLPARIRQHYFSRLGELPLDKQFHYASRLAAWNNDSDAVAVLEQLYPHFVPEFPADGALREVLDDLLKHPPEAKINAAKTRATYFKKYPTLRGIDFALFRVRHWLALYDIDARDALFNAIPEEDLAELEKKLLHDSDAMRTLSTYAINFVYLLERIMLERTDKKDIDLKLLYKIGQGYNKKDPEQLQLLIYFYTHCIIGDTNFYMHDVPDFALPTYRRMLQEIEKVIQNNYDSINLDNKLEFLVCARICNHTTPLFERIEAECEQSLSPEGDFLIDTHNHHKQGNKTSLSDSEHRNVLYIMSHLSFDKTSEAARPILP